MTAQDSKEELGRKKREVGKIHDTGLRHRNVSWGFGDSCTERWGCTDTAGPVSPCGCHSRQALCPMKKDHLSHPQPTVLFGGKRRHPPSSTAARFPLVGIHLLLCCPSSLPQVQCWGGLLGDIASEKEWRELRSQR